MTFVVRSPLARSIGARFAPAAHLNAAEVYMGPLVRRLAAVATAAGLFVLSWERLLNVPLGPYNVKLPSVFFVVAALVGVAAVVSERLAGRSAARSFRSSRTLVVWIAGAAVLSVAYYSVRALTVPLHTMGLAQLAAVLSGAVAPAIAVLAVVRQRGDLVWAFNWVLRGAYVASVYGLYQLFAFYVGLPQGIHYTGVAVGGTIGRIPAFSYEPAYFAYFLVLALGVLIARSAILQRSVPIGPAVLISSTLALASVRALLFLVPLLLVTLALSWRRNRRVIVRGVLLAILLFGSVSALNAGIKWSVAERAQAQAQAAEQAQASEVGTAPDTSESIVGAAPTAPAAAVPTTTPAPAATGRSAALSVFDPTEPTSNAPRLQGAERVIGLVSKHPLVGVGPGMLGSALSRGDSRPAKSVANNVYLQALVDGGAPLLLIELAMIAGVLVALFKLRGEPLQPLVAAWLSVLAVAGMLTSYFFDIKMWVVLALLIAALRLRVGGASTTDPSAQAPA